MTPSPSVLVPGVALLVALLALGCSCGDGMTPPDRLDAGALREAGLDARGLDAGSDAGLGTDAGALDGGAGLDAPSALDGGAPATDGGTPDAGSPDAGPPPGDVRFVVMGDTGEGNTAQRDVAIQIRDLCAREGCDFVLLLGDNIYDSGVDSVTDAQWTTKFETPYADIMLPFYAVLGNHDYGGSLFGLDYGGLGNEFGRGPIEVAYTAVSSRWEMPATHYTVQYENVGFIMLDTNSIMWANTDNGDQWAWYPTAVADLRASGAEWIVVSGHHPYRSNGRHGNAGAYEGIEVAGVLIPNPVPLLNGNNVRSFFDSVVCGTADVVFAGHDHNRQWLDEPTELCGAELIVSGAGAKTTSFESSTNDLLYGDDTTPGFMYVVISGDRMTGRFVDRTGAVNFEHEVMRRP